MRPIQPSAVQPEPISVPLGGLSARGVKLTCAAFVLAVAGGYLWLHWLQPFFHDLLSGRFG